MTKTWEYQEVYLNWGQRGWDIEDNAVFAEPIDKQLNKYGKEGWELVKLDQIPNKLCGNALFKRRL